jgi:hypothetical protein
MKTYARIDNGLVAELFDTDGDISEMFNPAIVWIDVTAIDPQPKAGWSYDGQLFTAPFTLPSSTLADLQAALCISVDAAADAAYVAIGGSSPGRLAEYKQAKADADVFKAAGYSGIVPGTIACWVQATGWTAQQACDDILSTADAWNNALVAIRSARLIGKANVKLAATSTDAELAANTAVANIHAVAAGL